MPTAVGMLYDLLHDSVHLCTGALELYPLDDPSAPSGQPAPTPTTNHLPAWNSMAMFTVQPGRSYHAVQVR